MDFSCCSSTCNMPRQLFFCCPPVCPPQQGHLERRRIHRLLCTLPSSHPTLPSRIPLPLHYRRVSLITPLLLTCLYCPCTYCCVSRETLACRKARRERTPSSAPFLPPAFSHQLALGTCLIPANVSPAEVQKVPISLLTVEQNR